ncbi:MAG: hypothetical protein R6W83_02640 [Cryobacterium sp.]
MDLFDHAAVMERQRSLAAAFPADRGEFERWEAVQESLRSVPPKFRDYWLRQRGLEDWLSPAQPASPESFGLRLVGKFGRGPAVEVTGRDTLVALTLGSEVALLSFADPDRPRVLSEIQFTKMMGQSQLVGNRLYASGNGVFEVWDITDATNPVQLSSQPWGIGDFQVNDTLLYFIVRDTFKVYSVRDPANLLPVASYRDSGWFLAASESLAVLGHNGGLRFVDISDPRNPHRAGSFAGELARSAQVRGSLCCATLESGTAPYPIRFVTLDVSDPASPRQLASLANAGGYDLFLDGPMVYASGRDIWTETFHIISIADSTAPAIVGQCPLPGTYKWGVWASASLAKALVADLNDGLAVVSTTNPGTPIRDTSMLGTGSSIGLQVRGGYCFVANESGGLKVLDVAEPATPTQVGQHDTLGEVETCYSVAVDDSFAYVGWFNSPLFRAIDVSDPASPRLAATCNTPNYAQDMVLRDSLVYCAENYKFEVVNVARPREPRVVGTVNLPERSYKLVLADTIAYVANLTSLQVLSIASPTAPRIIGAWNNYVTGVEVVGNRLYASGFDRFYSLDISNPANPQPLDSVYVERTMFDVAVIDTITYVGGWVMRAVSIADPLNLRVLDYLWVPPSQYIRRLVQSPPYVYVCATDGGVCIMETLATGLSERTNGEAEGSEVKLVPSHGGGRLRLSGPTPRSLSITVSDVAGRTVCRKTLRLPAVLDLTALPDGVYFVGAGTGRSVGKYVKSTRR